LKSVSLVRSCQIDLDVVEVKACGNNVKTVVVIILSSFDCSALDERTIRKAGPGANERSKYLADAPVSPSQGLPAGARKANDGQAALVVHINQQHPTLVMSGQAGRKIEREGCLADAAFEVDHADPLGQFCLPKNALVPSLSVRDCYTTINQSEPSNRTNMGCPLA
jgi:hypothetical protein